MRHATEFLQRTPAVGGRPVALVGYSAGAFLAVSLAASIPAVKAVVDCFGGGGAGSEPLDKEVAGLPPLLIIHGEADDVVPVARARELHDAVVKHGGKVEMRLYPGAGHGFVAPGAPGYSPERSKEVFGLMVTFLHRWLDP